MVANLVYCQPKTYTANTFSYCQNNAKFCWHYRQFFSQPTHSAYCQILVYLAVKMPIWQPCLPPLFLQPKICRTAKFLDCAGMGGARINKLGVDPNRKSCSMHCHFSSYNGLTYEKSEKCTACFVRAKNPINIWHRHCLSFATVVH